MLGPVQVLVLTVPDPARSAAVLDSLASLDGQAPVRLLAAFVVSAAEDGTVQLTADGSGPPTAASLFLGSSDDVDGEVSEDPDLWDLGEVVPPGSHAVVALLEHRWATPLADVLASAGGSVRHEAWLHRDDREALEVLLSD